MKRSYQLTKLARGDLDNIYDYGWEQFGDEVATAYLLKSRDQFVLLAENPHLGERVFHLRPNSYRSRVGRHAIYYEESNDKIVILRILHNRMESKLHL